jgi:unsaturated rhamnogalacturonyl hydrolase
MRRFHWVGLCAVLISAAGCASQDSAAPHSGSGGTQGTGGTDGTGGGDQAGGSGGTSSGTGGSTDTGGSTGTGGATDDGGTSNPDADTSSEGGTPGGDGGVIGGPGPASKSPFDWGKAVIETEIAGKNSLGTSYPEGLMLHGIYKAYKRLKDPKYLSILTNSADSYGVASGGSLDSIMHMTALVDAYELTQKAGYKNPADGTRRIFDNYPNVEGAFWHAKAASRAHQLWGDGVFMSLSFLTRYATEFHDPTVYPIAVTNLTVTYKHLVNSATGLLWHAYDDSGVADWSHTPSKTNEISWGRAMGWFGMASVMTLEMLPANDPGRPALEKILGDLVTAWKKYQDPATGRWFQVVDKGSDSENWTETSASSMYTYVTYWAYQHQLVDASFADVATKGFNGVMQKVTKDANDHTTIATICQGLNASSDLVGNYYHHGVASNDPHGVGAFLLMWEGLQ